MSREEEAYNEYLAQKSEEDRQLQRKHEDVYAEIEHLHHVLSKATAKQNKLRRALQDLIDQVGTLSDWTFNGDLEPHEHETCFEGVIDNAKRLLKEITS